MTDELLRIAQILTPVVVAIIGWLVRQSLGRITDRIEDLEEGHEELKATCEKKNEGLAKECKECRQTVSMELSNRVLREDHIRETSRTRQAIEKLGEMQAYMNGKLDSGMRIAAAIESLKPQEEGRGDVIGG